MPIRSTAAAHNIVVTHVDQAQRIVELSGAVSDITGYNVRVNGANSVSGGTSAVAPLWASLTAVLSQQLGRKAGFFIPLLYANPGAAATNSIVSGDNSVFGVVGYAAKAGWNACTGLGSPNGAKLLSLLSGTQAPIAAPQPAAPRPGNIAPPPAATPPAVVQSRTGSLFDAKAAVLYGRFVQAAYTMYHADPTNLTPPPSSDFPTGYQLVGWIQMQDFILGSIGPTFYGFIAQSTSNVNQFIVAIRGTSNGVEWWDDANAVIKTPFKVPGCGSIGSGFARIYDTLEVVERPSPSVPAVAARSLRSAGTFAQQISDLITRHAIASARAVGLSAASSVDVTGHSLGAALATLYNACTNQISNPLLCTFASPLVGDDTFAAAFNAIGLTSWRIQSRPRSKTSTGDLWLQAHRYASALQFHRQGQVISIVLACFGDVPQFD
jgi:hypothetical protein